MPLYDLAIGDGLQHERGAILLMILGDPFVARYRDAWVEKSDDGPVIAVYTRQGGGNRECFCGESGDGNPFRQPDPRPFAERHVPASCYAACNEVLAAHPLYLSDADDDFDGTYATFRFRPPEQFREALEGAAVEPVNMSERWQAAIDRLKRGEVSPAETAMMDQVAAALNDGVKVIEI